MIRRVTQTRTGYPAGNCTEASIASVMGCDLAEVPDLWSGRMDAGTYAEAQPPERFAALVAWLAARGLEWRGNSDLPPMSIPLQRSDYPSGMAAFYDSPHFFAGPNPDGVNHMVVALRGAIIWDPNPSRRGIVHATEITALFPLSPPGGAGQEG